MGNLVCRQHWPLVGGGVFTIKAAFETNASRRLTSSGASSAGHRARRGCSRKRDKWCAGGIGPYSSIESNSGIPGCTLECWGQRRAAGKS